MNLASGGKNISVLLENAKYVNLKKKEQREMSK